MRKATVGTSPVLVSYLRSVGGVGVAACEVLAGSSWSIEAGGTGASPMPWLGKGGLARCREDEMWPPRVFVIGAAWIEKVFNEGEILLVCCEMDCIRLQAMVESSIVLRVLDFHCPIRINLMNCEGASPPQLQFSRKDVEL